MATQPGVINKTLLVDTDILFFKFACRNENIIDWGDGESLDIDEDKAIIEFDSFLIDVIEKTECRELMLCMTHDVNFRYSVLPTYKHNRQDKVRPELIKTLKEHAWTNYPCKQVKWLEADDVMGILGSKDPNKYVVASTDKDMKTVPCTLFNWDKDEKPRRISIEEADYWFHYQWLTGDSTDGYTGCPKIGPVKAKRLLDDTPREEWVEVILEKYAEKCFSYKEILQQARVARILRYGEYDFKNKEVILWQPKFHSNS
jgi:DNA polymerase-1